MFKRIVFSFIASAALVAAAELPSAEALLGRYLEASGGRAAFDRVKTVSSKGSIEFVGQGIKGSIATVTARPDSLDMTMELPGIGKIRSGVSDGIAWRNSALQGPAVLKGQEREQLLRTAIFDSPARWREVYGEVKVEGEDTVEGKPCWRAQAMPPRATKPETLWFDKQSGLLLKTAMTLVSEMGEIPVVSLYLDYREVEGLRIPVKVRESVGPQVIDSMIDEVKLNAAVAPGQFEAPQEVRALLNKK